MFPPHTYKGISGLGEDGSSVQPVYRYVDPSHVGILDLDASSASDPGMSGVLCPLQRIYGDSISFSEFEEPNTWQEELTKTLAGFRELNGKEQVFEALDKLLGEDHTEEITMLNSEIEVARKVIHPFIYTDVGEYGGLPLEGSGTIQLTVEEEIH